MGYALTDSQKRLVQELLKIGRWNNESEIVRYGLHLVAREVEAEQVRSYEPYGAGVLKRAYKKLSKVDREEESDMARASVKPSAGELE
jgi:Arc/MetJ-type ribon-helix-helix transcriptional regulator